MKKIKSGDSIVVDFDKEKGTIIIFDSRMRHRVRKVKSGTRKSIVGWVEGPRWK